MNDTRMVVFLSGGQTYAVPIREVAEVVDAAKVESVPGGVAPLEGLMIHRGKQVLPVFVLPRAGKDPEGGIGHLVMVVRTDGGLAGFRLERVLGVMPMPEEGPENVSPDTPEPLRGVSRGELPFKGGKLMVLDATKAMAPLTAP